jgi:hypothetical protein
MKAWPAELSSVDTLMLLHSHLWTKTMHSCWRLVLHGVLSL